MCLIVFAWQPGRPLPLIVAANRDEFHARPTEPLNEWPDAPGLLAGRDLRAGGTWLGITRAGRFAALTNVRAPGRPAGATSRGALAERFLRGEQTPADYLTEVLDRLGEFAGFNLLVGDGQTLGYLNSDEAQPLMLAPGVYGLSNARLDSPWPKLVQTRDALRECLSAPSSEGLFAVLRNDQQAPDDALPNTGVSLEWERLLSSAFIVGKDYGTRSSTVLITRADGSFELTERRFGPDAAPLGETRF